MRRWLMPLLAILAAIGLDFIAVQNAIAICRLNLAWYWWLLVAAEALASASLFVCSFQIVSRSQVDKSKPLDLTTELQAQLAAEMIRQHSLKRIDISQDGGMAINGNRVGGV